MTFFVLKEGQQWLMNQTVSWQAIHNLQSALTVHVLSTQKVLHKPVALALANAN